MKKLEVSKMESLQGGKFWGWDQQVDIGTCGFNTAGQCGCNYTETYYAFGIGIATRTGYGSADPSFCGA